MPPLYVLQYDRDVTLPLHSPLPDVLGSRGITEREWKDMLRAMDEGHRQIIPNVGVDVLVAIVAFATLALIPCWIARFRHQHRRVFELTVAISKEHLEHHGLVVRYYPAGQYHNAALQFFEFGSPEVDMEYKCDCCGRCKF